MNLRLLAARIIDDVTNGRSLSDCLQPRLANIKDARDRAFLQAICYGVCRSYARLDVVLSHLLKKPMDAKDSEVHALILVGLYQLMEMRVPDHAAVSETVNATEKLKKPWARGFVNAVLREYTRNRQQLEDEIAHDAEAYFAHPVWWIDMIEEAWPEQWEDILNANNAHPPFALRVNQSHATREKYLEKLTAELVTAKAIPETSNGIILETPVMVDELPGFAEGDVSVQDGAAQLAAELLALAPGQRVLDACAAPGGKLTHILELEPKLAEVVAVENDPQRIPAIKENLTRLKLQAKCICHDANDVEGWWDEKLFDRILLDAPCSASGVIRRHPDIKLLRQPDDIQNMAHDQLELLESLWPTLKPDGLLVYATCSIFPEENTHVMQKFIAAHDDAVEEKIDAEWGLACEIGRQILPGMHDMDGFYYARLRKK